MQSFSVSRNIPAFVLLTTLVVCIQHTIPVQSQGELGYLLNSNELMALAQDYGHGYHHPPPPKPKKSHHAHHYNKGGHDHG